MLSGRVLSDSSAFSRHARSRSLPDLEENSEASVVNSCCVRAGRVTGTTSVSGANLTLSGPGSYTYTHALKAMERLNISLTLDGSLVGESQLLNITSVLPSVINVSKSLDAASVQRSGDTSKIGWSASEPLALPAHSWHLLHVPVLLSGRVGSTFADPKLGARLAVAMPVTSVLPATHTSNTVTTTTTQTALFYGYWSSSSAAYLVPFKLTALGNITGELHLLSNATDNTTMVGVSGASRCHKLRRLCNPTGISLPQI